MKIIKHYIIHGRVQGVGFRFYVKSISQMMGVFGWVKNKIDGTVEVMAEIDQNQISEYEAKLEKGSSYSRVDYIEKEMVKDQRKFYNFKILY